MVLSGAAADGAVLVAALGPHWRARLEAGGPERDEAEARLRYLAEALGGAGAAEWDGGGLSPSLIAEAAAEIMAAHDRDVPAARMAARRQMVLSRAAARVAAAARPAPATLRSDTPRARVAEQGCALTHDGFFQTRAYDLRHPRFDGTQSPRLAREVFVATDAALVLPYDPRRDRVLLVEQFRMGPYGRGDPLPWMLEPIAGRIDAGEAPEDTARRETREEAGLELTALERISSHYCTPGYSTEFFHLFLGLCDLPDTRAGHGGLATENEDIRTHVIGFDRAMELLTSGEANNGPLVLALLWLARERARLRGSG